MTEVAVDGDDAASGLVALVVAIIEILVEALEREAIRRMDGGSLTDEEVERLGRQLATIEEELDRLAEQEGVKDDVRRLRGQLNDAVTEGLYRVAETDRRTRHPPPVEPDEEPEGYER